MTPPQTISDVFKNVPGLARAGDFHAESVEAASSPLTQRTPEDARKILGLAETRLTVEITKGRLP
jgi:hypothetical protein